MIERWIEWLRLELEVLPTWILQSLVVAFFLVALIQAFRWIRLARWKPRVDFVMPEAFDPKDFDQNPDFGYKDKRLNHSTGKRKKVVKFDLPVPEPTGSGALDNAFQRNIKPSGPGLLGKFWVLLALLTLVLAGLYRAGILQHI